MTYNHITLVGNVAKDPVMTKVGDISKTTFTLAVGRYAGKDKEAETDFFTIVLWRSLAEIADRYLNKGSKCLIDGKLQIRTYEKDGQKKYITEIIADNLKFLSPKNQPTQPKEEKTENYEEDIPF